MQKNKINLNTFNPSFNEENNTPVLFEIKKKKNINNPLNYLRTDTGRSRHFTPAAQEWYNSVYSYNFNYTKSLSVADKNLMNLLKTYFNSRLSNKILNIKTKPMDIKLRRLSTKRIFVGKGELKHTSRNVIITFYTYNTEGMFLFDTVQKLYQALIKPRVKLIKTITKDTKGKNIISYNRPHTLTEFLSLRDQYASYLIFITGILHKLSGKFSKLSTYIESLITLVDKKIISEDDKTIILNNRNFNTERFDYFNLLNIMDFNYFKEKVQKVRYEKNLVLNTKLLLFNKQKYKEIFKLIDLVKKLYNKSVLFNIVDLKKMHLNSDIYTQAVSLKLKNKDNKLFWVLKSSLRKIKLPIISIISEQQNKYNVDEVLVNKIRNNLISNMFTNDTDKDSLNNLLLDFFPSADKLEISIPKRSYIKKRSISLKSYVFRYLKHNKLRGIRVEAKGRLTRRLTASRSVFKMKWLGGLKNVDSSFKGWSAIMLRGYLKSNVQYSSLNSKNRNGAFGVKGWVSSKSYL
jgi:Mitochondrial ribosomal protein (VAR1)